MMNPHKIVRKGSSAIVRFAMTATILCIADQSHGAPVEVNRESASTNEKAVLCRAIGVNFYDAFYRQLFNSSDQSMEAGFAALQSAGIPFVRFMATGFWPNELKRFVEDPQSYLALLDKVVRAGERHGIGLVPSLAWNYGTIPDLVGEPVSAWGNPQSKTIAFMKRYVQAIVGRYRDSKAIWAWEFGNELNLRIDFPIPSRVRPQIDFAKGTPRTRSDRDDLRLKDAQVAWETFAKTVRELDKTRPISTGNDLPRPFARNAMVGKLWKQDTREEFGEALTSQNPAGIDLVSIHVYPHHRHHFFTDENVDYAALLGEVLRASSNAGKAVFIGEFGVSEELGKSTRKEFEDMLAAIESTEISLAALWVYDFKHQNGTYNVTFDGARAYQFNAISAVNKRFRQQGRLCN